MRPTPIEALCELQGNQLWVKRDDLLPFCFGGNKYRKALRFFEQIDALGCDAVVTYGTRHSNHCRIVANMAAARGLKCVIVSAMEAKDDTYNSMMMRLFGAEFRTVPVQKVHQTLEDTVEELRQAGRKPYLIEGGGHGDLGTAAYVDCFQEISDWCGEQRCSFDYIFHASGTGTTQAGLICGKLLRGDPTEIIGISIARKNPRGREVVLNSVRSYLRSVGASVSEVEIQAATVFPDEYTGAGYSASSPEILETVRRMLVRYGLPLDTTYTGKAFYGMERWLKAHRISGKQILFLHTGGTPLFFDDLNRMEQIL